eukprot:2072535-Amphidinium_carterae.1
MVVWSDEKLFRMQATNVNAQNKRFWTHLASKKEALAANPNLGVLEQSKGISRGVMVFMMVSVAGGCSQPAFIPENVKIN